MWLKIFDVEHGQCSIASDGINYILIDAGHNSTTNWRPSTWFSSRQISEIECFLLTNIDEDHASDLHNVTSRVPQINLLATNPSLRGKVFEIKDMVGEGISEASKMLDRFNGPSRPINFRNLEYKKFYHEYPTFEDENNLSTINFLSFNGVTFLFAGDMERAGWMEMMEDASFVRELSSVDVLIASHHGRKSGCCDELFSIGKLCPQLTIISDAGKQFSTQDTIDWYALRTSGVQINGKNRKVLTTRRDGVISFNLDAMIVSVGDYD